jgi:hypothetical protein
MLNLHIYAIALIREILQYRHHPSPAIINRTWYLSILLIFVLTHNASEDLLPLPLYSSNSLGVDTKLLAHQPCAPPQHLEQHPQTLGTPLA